MSKQSSIAEATSKAHVIANVCSNLSSGNLHDAAQILREQYPFDRPKNAGRRWTTLESLEIFIRDGFRDRYSGLRLVFPGTLRAISLLLPTDFPFHRNWKTDECHFAYWQLLPTIDHVVPVSRDGADDRTNWFTTSMVKNAVKANFTLEEIGWQLLPQKTESDWDGLTSWFSEELGRTPHLLKDAYIQRWNGALRAVRSRQKIGEDESLWNRD
jgi:hypothetical protein